MCLRDPGVQRLHRENLSTKPNLLILIHSTKLVSFLLWVKRDTNAQTKHVLVFWVWQSKLSFSHPLDQLFPVTWTTSSGQDSERLISQSHEWLLVANGRYPLTCPVLQSLLMSHSLWFITYLPHLYLLYLVLLLGACKAINF